MITGSAFISKLLKITDDVVAKVKKVKNVGKYDWDLVKRYFKHIQEVTDRSIGQKQVDKLIEDWEKETGQTWLVLEEDLYNAEGKLIAKKGR